MKTDPTLSECEKCKNPKEMKVKFLSAEERYGNYVEVEIWQCLTCKEIEVIK